MNEVFQRRFHTSSDFSKEMDSFLLRLISAGVVSIKLGETGANG
jgi:hypothetical protein